jgi:hypothetical protein
MTTALIVVLVVVAVYLGKRWGDAAAENSRLRLTVTSLKRQLERRNR